MKAKGTFTFTKTKFFDIIYHAYTYKYWWSAVELKRYRDVKKEIVLAQRDILFKCERPKLDKG